MLRKDLYRQGSVASAALLAVAMLAGPAAADETDAKTILKAMSDYMTAQQTFAFDFDSTLQIVTTEDQKIDLASSGSVAVERPGKLHATRTGGFADLEIGYDGATVTLIGKNAGLFTELPVEGTIDTMIDTLRDEHGIVLPAADLLMSDPEKLLMDGVSDVKDLGWGVIGGEVCDHIALRGEDVDMQIWIAQGDAPRPCRYSITARDVAQQPEFSIEIRNWTTDVASDALTVSIPSGTEQVEVGALAKATEELPENFTIGAEK